MSQPPKKLTLYTNHLAPDGLKVSIYLEELKAADPTVLEYKIATVDLQKKENKKPDFLKLNPDGHIPVLVDHSQNDFPVFESGAILLYLEQNYDKSKRFSFDGIKASREYSLMLQWVFFTHGRLGPMQGQAHFFSHYSLEDAPYSKKKFQDETKRLYGVLNTYLAGRDWLVGPRRGQFTIADMNALPWVRLHARAGIETLDDFINLKSWLSRSLDRSGVKAAIQSVAL